MALEVQLVSPEKILFTGEARSVLARTIGGGDIAFLTGHAPFIGALDIWPVTIHLEDGDDVVVAVHGGFVEVSGSRITILSDVAELPDQIDVGRAETARSNAEEALRAAPQDSDEAAEAKAALARATSRVLVATGKVAASH
jgi:F-type H+-transporting ATPase subunit epsilon